jgi:hypothetical protein
MTPDFKHISIRGRLAFGMICLEKLVHTQNADHLLLHNIVFPKIWEFTSAHDLSEWEQMINLVDPSTVLYDDVDPDLKSLYQTLSEDIVHTISNVIEIGAGNIYGGTGDYSPYSLAPLNEVIHTMIKLQVPLPDIAPFKKSGFSEDGGWGAEHPREYYLS